MQGMLPCQKYDAAVSLKYGWEWLPSWVPLLLEKRVVD
jgi:hypothetical protein